MRISINPIDQLFIAIVIGTLIAFLVWKFKKKDKSFKEYWEKNLEGYAFLAFLIMVVIIIFIRVITEDPTL